MKVRLNLATAPLENHRRFLLGAALGGGAALALFLLLSMQAYRNWRSSSELRAETARLQGEMMKFREERRLLEDFFSTPDARRIRDRADFLNGLIQQRSFPWTKIFENLEEKLPAGVRVVSISPRMDKGRVEVKLVVGANSDENKIKFLEALEQSEEFSRVQVVSENRPLRTDADALLLEVVAWYKTVLPPAGVPAAGPATAAAARRGGGN
jgi:Tfp pilus assembly protein PilN